MTDRRLVMPVADHQPLVLRRELGIDPVGLVGGGAQHDDWSSSVPRWSSPGCGLCPARCVGRVARASVVCGTRVQLQHRGARIPGPLWRSACRNSVRPSAADQVPDRPVPRRDDHAAGLITAAREALALWGTSDGADDMDFAELAEDIAREAEQALFLTRQIKQDRRASREPLRRRRRRPGQLRRRMRTLGQVEGFPDLHHFPGTRGHGVPSVGWFARQTKPTRRRNPARYLRLRVNQLFRGRRPGILVSTDPEKPCPPNRSELTAYKESDVSVGNSFRG